MVLIIHIKTDYGFIKACVSSNNEKTLAIIDYWNKNNEKEILKKLYNEYKMSGYLRIIYFG